jgi:hypothetical protein
MFSLLGCTNGSNYGSVVSHGIIIDVDTAKKEILIDDKTNGPIWVGLIYLK